MALADQTALTTRRFRWSLRQRSILIGFGILVVVLLVLTGAPSVQDGSTYLRSPTGYSQWYQYMQQGGAPIQRWQRDYKQLQGSHQTLIQIWGNRSTPPDLTEAEIETWLRQGNTLITLTWRGRVTAAPFSSQLDSAVGPVTIDTTRRQRLQLQNQEQANLEDASGTVVWQQSVGKGERIAATYPWLAANAYNGQARNYQYLATLARQRGGQIWIDEWLHGYRDPDSQAGIAGKQKYRNLVDFLSRTPIAAIAFQIMFVILLAIWANNRRFGPIEPIAEPQPTNSEQYMQALAGVLNQAGQRAFVVTLLQQRLRYQVATRLGLAARESQGQSLRDDADLAVQWASRSGRSPQELEQLLVQSSGKQRFTDQDLLAWVSKAESILRGLS